MADYFIDDSTLTGIADAIRTKSGSNDEILVSDMANTIENMELLVDYENTKATSVVDYAFYGFDRLKSASFPNVTSIGNSAFYNCFKLKQINLPNVTSIGKSAFNSYKYTGVLEVYSNLIENMNFPLVTSIGENAFSNCVHLKNIQIPLVTTLNKNTFYGCDSLEFIELPSVTSMYTHAIAYCDNLKTIVLSANTVCDPTYNVNNASMSSIYGCPNLESIYVPDSLVESYKSNTRWSRYLSYIKPLSEYTGGDSSV